MFPPLDVPFEYWIEHVTFGLLYAMFRFATMIFYSEVAGFGTDRPCGGWCQRLTLHLPPVCWSTVWKSNLKWYLVGLKVWCNAEQRFHCCWLYFTYILMHHDMIILYFRLPYFHVPNSTLFLHKWNIDTFYWVSCLIIAVESAHYSITECYQLIKHFESVCLDYISRVYCSWKLALGCPGFSLHWRGQGVYREVILSGEWSAL